jgi:hypothetical protein
MSRPRRRRGAMAPTSATSRRTCRSQPRPPWRPVFAVTASSSAPIAPMPAPAAPWRRPGAHVSTSSSRAIFRRLDRWPPSAARAPIARNSDAPAQAFGACPDLARRIFRARAPMATRTAPPGRPWPRPPGPGLPIARNRSPSPRPARHRSRSVADAGGMARPGDGARAPRDGIGQRPSSFPLNKNPQPCFLSFCGTGHAGETPATWSGRGLGYVRTQCADAFASIEIIPRRARGGNRSEMGLAIPTGAAST